MRLPQLEELAKRLTGRDVWVGLVDLPTGTLGTASQPARGLYAVKLSPDLLDDARSLSFVFYHECGHIALDHVPVTDDPLWYEYAPLAHEMHRDRRENDANDYAQRQLDRLGAIEMTTITDSRKGTSIWTSDWGLNHIAKRYTGRDDVRVSVAHCAGGYLSECVYDGVDGYRVTLDPSLFSGRKSLLGREFWRAIAAIRLRLVGSEWGYSAQQDLVAKSFYAASPRELDARWIEATAAGYRLEAEFLQRLGKSSTFDAVAYRQT